MCFYEVNHQDGQPAWNAYFRWIAAEEAQTGSCSAFLAPIPDGTLGVGNVKLTASGIEISLEGVDKTITLAVQHCRNTYILSAGSC